MFLSGNTVAEAIIRPAMNRFSLRITVETPVGSASDFLAGHSGLSKSKVKDAMNKGAVLIRKNGRMQRLRRATARLNRGDRIEFHYDESVLAIIPPSPILISDEGRYSVWHKPAGLMAQGGLYGDHCSLVRQVELFFGCKREVYPVHRIDREAAGIMLLGHSAQAAARLSELFRENKIIKQYRVEVRGNMDKAGTGNIIDLPLDGKEAGTEFRVLSYEADRDISVLDVRLLTGRLHQIRRHLNMIGHPVMGDPKYGKGNKNREGLRLTAYYLSFRCPIRKMQVEYKVSETPG